MISKLGERRHLTVVFCDLVGSTFLAEELDPEELRDLVRAYQQVCATVVARFDGHIAQYLGDGVLIYFGFPNAHEEDPVRAVHAGLGIVQAMSRFEFQRADGGLTKLSVRLGVHTGLAVAGEMGSWDRPEMLALGSTPNVAARLQTLAAQNSVVVSAETRRLTEGYFEFQELEERARAGSNVIVGHRVLGTSGLQTAFEHSVARGLTPFQNREAVIASLSQRWLSVTQGEGGMVLLRGEAGIGKSRLLHHFQEMVVADGARWIVGRGSSFKQDDAFWPLSEALRQLLSSQTPPSSDAWTAILREHLNEVGIDSEAHISRLAALLGVASLPTPSDSLELDAQQWRRQTLEMGINLLLRASRRQPLVLCFEDLQWFDPSTLEFLSEVTTRLQAERVLVVLTARPTFDHGLTHRSELLSFDLAPLAAREVQAIVRHICRASELPENVVGQIVTRTDGVPLFVEELTKSILESEVSTQPTQDMGAQVTIPATLQDSLMARLDRLPLGKRVAQLAAVLGREFELAVLTSCGLFDSGTIDEGIEQLLAADLVRPLEGSMTQAYTFKHALVQDVAYESLLRRDRRGYHKRIAETLLERFPETESRQPELVAHHLTESAQSDKAIEYWLLAAKRSVERGANAEAQRYLERARSGATSMPEGSLRWERELQVEMLNAQLARATAGYASQEMENSYAHALDLCQRLGDGAGSAADTRMLVARVRCGEDFLTRSLAQNPRVGNRLFWIMWGFGAYHQSRAELSRALDIGNQLVDLAAEEPALALEGHFGAGSTCFFMGRMPEARDHLEQGWKCFEAMDRVAETSPTGHHAEVLCAGYMSLTLLYLGQGEEAKTKSQQAIAVARRAKHNYSVAYALVVAAWLGQMSGDRALARERAEEALALAKQFGFGFAHMWVLPISLWLEGTEPLHAADVVERFRSHLAAYRQSGYRIALTYFQSLLAEVLIAEGGFAEASATVAEALELANTGGEHFCLRQLQRLRGDLLAQTKLTEARLAQQGALGTAEFAKGP